MTAPFSDFVPAEAPIQLDLKPRPRRPGTLGARATDDGVGVLEFQPDPGEGAVYALIHEVHTPDGIAYEVTLPQPDSRPGGTLGSAGAGKLRFPVHRFATGSSKQASGRKPRTLGAADALAGAAGDVVFKHVLHLVKAPFVSGLKQLIAAVEGDPQPFAVHHDGSLRPLIGREDWRRLFANPAQEQRVLLFVHGFMSSSENSLPRGLLPQLRSNYAAVLAYSHPTISQDPKQNADQLLKRIPADLRLKVDLLAHSRGGLVARSLVELQEARPSFNVRRLVTCGSPHGGTLLAQRDRYDQLVSICMTASSWLLSASGAGAPATFVPKLLEYILRAGTQLFFDLPGVNAMVPGSEFLKGLNALGDPTLAERVPYAAVASTFNLADIKQIGFREALTALAVRAFMRAPNDLVVNTSSMSEIDISNATFAGRTLKTDVNHYSYFDKPEVREFVQEVLR